MAKILVTGINGFAASHLARQLVDEGHEVHGTVRVRSDLYKLEDILNKITLHLVELTDSLSVEKIVRELKPNEVYHLAAQSFVRLSWDAPSETYRVNIDGTINLLEAIKKLDVQPAILITSTSEIYGEIEGMINEETPPNPLTHYGISKYAQDMIGRLYNRSFGMNIVLTRSFNITGPGRGSVFVDSSFAKQIADIEKGKQDSILHGNLESERDFVDVRDVVRGYVKALRSQRWGEVFCFGTGKPIKIQKILDILKSFSTLNITTKLDPKRLRPIDTKSMQCDYSKTKKILNWEPTIPLEQSLKDLLEYWRLK